MVQVRDAAQRMGVEVVGVDVTNLDSGAFDEIYQAFINRGVLVVRGQKLEIPQWLDFCRRFGRLRPHINRARRHPEYPDLLMLDNLAVAGKQADPRMVKSGYVWHSDLGYEKEPAKATGLYSVHIPSSGGDTLFKSMYDAYDRLPEPLKKRIEGKKALFNYGGRTKTNLHLLDKSEHERPPAMHDLVRVHPETGRKALYPSPNQILGIAGASEEESNALLEELLPLVTDSEPDYRHKWQLGDIVIWDNRCVLHRATGDYPLHERRLHWRATIMQQQAAGQQALSA